MEKTIIKLNELKLEKNKVRVHSETQINALVKSLTQFGQTRLVIVDEDYNVLIGRGLCMALEKMGKEEVECHIMHGLTENEKRKLMLSDNKIFQLGHENDEEVDEILKELAKDADFDIAGYDPEILKEIVEVNTKDLKELGEMVVSQDVKLVPVEELQKKYQTQPQPQAESGVSVTPLQPQEPFGNGNYPNVDHTTGRVDKKVRAIVCPNCGEVIYIDE